MEGHYTGIGSKFHDLVTEQIEDTARNAAPGLRQQLFPDEDDDKST
jgi:hypothetical protein